MRISDWSSDVCSSDLALNVNVDDAYKELCEPTVSSVYNNDSSQGNALAMTNVTSCNWLLLLTRRASMQSTTQIESWIGDKCWMSTNEQPSNVSYSATSLVWVRCNNARWLSNSLDRQSTRLNSSH